MFSTERFDFTIPAARRTPALAFAVSIAVMVSVVALIATLGTLGYRESPGATAISGEEAAAVMSGP